jgi:hypothetical protein
MSEIFNFAPLKKVVRAPPTWPTAVLFFAEQQVFLSAHSESRRSVAHGGVLL